MCEMDKLPQMEIFASERVYKIITKTTIKATMLITVKSQNIRLSKNEIIAKF